MSRYLLDTHALLWAIATPTRLSRTARRLITNERNELLVSAVSAWEISTKDRIGKLPGAASLLVTWEDALAELRAVSVPISHRVALRAGAHPAAHRDPFDRLLAAEAEISGCELITADPAFAEFGVRTAW